MGNTRKFVRYRGGVEPQRSQTSTRAPAASPGPTVRFQASKWSTRSSAGCGTPHGTGSEHSFHGIKRGLDEIVYVPSLVDVAGRGGPELHPHGKPRLLLRGQHASRKHRGSDGLLPSSLVAGGEGCWTTNDLELDQLPHRLNSGREAAWWAAALTRRCGAATRPLDAVVLGHPWGLQGRALRTKATTAATSTGCAVSTSRRGRPPATGSATSSFQSSSTSRSPSKCPA